VTTQDVRVGAVSTKAGIAVYPSRSKLREVYRSYAEKLEEGNCENSRNVRGTWRERVFRH
jgi:hypothetical protein